MFQGTYSVLRYVPSIPREEFLNVGVLLVCPQLQYQRILALPDYGQGSRIEALQQTDEAFVEHAVGKLRIALEDQHRFKKWGQRAGGRQAAYTRSDNNCFLCNDLSHAVTSRTFLKIA